MELINSPQPAPEMEYDLKPTQIGRVTINEEILFEHHNDISVERFLSKYYDYHQRLMEYVGRYRATKLKFLQEKETLTAEEQTELDNILKSPVIGDYKPVAADEVVVEPLMSAMVRKGFATLLWLHNRKEYPDLKIDYLLNLDGLVIDKLIFETLMFRPEEGEGGPLVDDQLRGLKSNNGEGPIGESVNSPVSLPSQSTSPEQVSELSAPTTQLETA